jgi:hypothetical protein
MEYLHVEVESVQTPKRPGLPCGDVIECDRAPGATTLVLSDGLGTGIAAHLASQFNVSRLLGRVRTGASVRKAFLGNVETMEKNRGGNLPWAAFSVLRVLPEGAATVLAYEAPHPILLNERHAQVLPLRPMPFGTADVGEVHCHLRSGDSVLLLSDGITQAGLGRGLPGMAEGWGIEGVCRAVGRLLSEGCRVEKIPGEIHREALRLWGEAGDDCSVTLAHCREGITVSLLTGPPSMPEKDAQSVRDFLKSGGLHIVCGATTASIVARELRGKLDIRLDSDGSIGPPGYKVDGIDLVTEGTVSLNQLYNVIDADSDELDPRSPVTELITLLMIADRIRIWMGTRVNPAVQDIAYQQQGILLRHKIVPLLAERFRAKGKMVEMHYL